MKKFECNDCEADCELTMQMDELTPSYCLYDKEKANWHEVEDSAENAHTTNVQFGNSEQLPDWVKVGASVYNIEKKQYQTISLINGTVICNNIDGDGCTQYGYGAFINDCVKAHKRPFNSKEMKNLAGSFATTFDGDVSMITDYDWFAEKVKICGEWLCAEELMESTWRVYNKPCFKLEHLENGEWVG